MVCRHLGLVVFQPVSLVHNQTGPFNGAQHGLVNGNQLVGRQQDMKLNRRVFLQSGHISVKGEEAELLGPGATANAFNLDDLTYHHIWFLSHLHLGCFFPTSDGIPFEGKLVLSDHGSAVLVADVRDHVHVRGPHLELSLPVDDGGQRGAHQKGTFGVTLGGLGGG